MTLRAVGRRRGLLATVLMVVAGMGAVVLPAAPASADPVFDPGPIAASPGCLGRSGASQYIEAPVTSSPYLIETRSYVALSECDTQNLIQSLGKGAVATGACTLAFKAVGTFIPPAKFGASIGELICGAATLGQGGLGALLNQTDQNGGGCGVIIKFNLTITINMMGEGQASVVINGMQFNPRPCSPGVRPKADLGTIVVAGPPMPIDWNTYDYASLPDLPQVVTDPVLSDTQEHRRDWIKTPPVTVPVPDCAPVKLNIPLTGLGATQATVESVTGTDQFAHGRIDPWLFQQHVGKEVDFTPLSDGSDTLTYTLRSEVLVTSTVTFQVTGCRTPEQMPEPWVRPGNFPVSLPSGASCAVAVNTATFTDQNLGASPGCTAGGPGDQPVFVVLGSTCSATNNGQAGEPTPTLSYLQYGCTPGTRRQGEILRYDVPVRFTTTTDSGTQTVNPDCSVYNGESGAYPYGRFNASWSRVSLRLQAMYNGRWVDQYSQVDGGHVGGDCQDPDPMLPYYETHGFRGSFAYTGMPFAFVVPVSATTCTGWESPSSWNNFCGIAVG